MCVITNKQTHTHTHTHVALAPSYLIGGPNSMGWQGRERGGGISLYDDIRGKFLNGASELRFFKGEAECLVLVLQPTKFLATGGAKVG